MIFCYITCKNKSEAKNIAKHILSLKLAGCANIFPIDSIYTWKGKLVKSYEVVLILKTISKNYSIIQKEVKKIHSYDVPCIIKINVKANRDYDMWIKSNTD